MKITQTCDCCNGSGKRLKDICISDWTPPEHHEDADKLEAIVSDAYKAKSDHRRLCILNPRAIESYDRQLGETLALLEKAAKYLL